MVSAIRNNMQSVLLKVSSSSSNIQTISLCELLQVVWQISLLHTIIVRQWVYQMLVSVWKQQSHQHQHIQNSVHKFKPATKNIKFDTTTNRYCTCCRCRSSNMMSAMQVMMRGKYLYTLWLMLIFKQFSKYLRNFVFHVFILF